MDKTQAEIIFDTLYSNIDGYKISRLARSKIPYYNITHTYGEVLFDTFWDILQKVNPKKNSVFYDLGAGTGKPCIVASLFTAFSKVVGIEILPDIYKTSTEVLDSYKALLAKRKITLNQLVQFVNADFKDVIITDADVVFVNATCFQYETSRLMMEQFSNLKQGAKIITSTYYIDLPGYTHEDLGIKMFSWGRALAYISTKVI